MHLPPRPDPCFLYPRTGAAAFEVMSRRPRDRVWLVPYAFVLALGLTWGAYAADVCGKPWLTAGLGAAAWLLIAAGLVWAWRDSDL